MNYQDAKDAILEEIVPEGLFRAENMAAALEKESHVKHSRIQSAFEEGLEVDSLETRALIQSLARIVPPGISDAALRTYAISLAKDNAKSALLEEWIAKYLVLDSL